jgi:hypothetical protein
MSVNLICGMICSSQSCKIFIQDARLRGQRTDSRFIATSSVLAFNTSTSSSHDFWICSSNPLVSERFKSRNRSGKGSALRPEKDVNTDDMSPSCLSFRVRGTASVAMRRWVSGVTSFPEHFPARKAEHLRHLDATILFMVGFVKDSL